MSSAHDDIRRAVRDELTRNDLPGPTTGPEVGIFNLVVRVAGNLLEDARGAAADCAAAAGAQVAREQATDRATDSVRPTSDFDRFDRPHLSPELAEVADLLQERAQGAPPLEDDRVAVMLGLVAAKWCGDDEPHEPHGACLGTSVAPPISARLVTAAAATSGGPRAVATVLRVVADHISSFELMEDEIGTGPEFDDGMRTAYAQLSNSFRAWADEIEDPSDPREDAR